MIAVSAPTFQEPQWFILRGWLDEQEWGDEPPDPDDVWTVGDRVRLVGSSIEGTVHLTEEQQFLGTYLPLVLVLWDNKTIPIPVEPELLIRLTRYLPPLLTWRAPESFSDEPKPKDLQNSHIGIAQGQKIEEPTTFFARTHCPDDSEQLLDQSHACSICESLLVGIEKSPSKSREQFNVNSSENSPSNDITTSNDSPSKSREQPGVCRSENNPSNDITTSKSRRNRGEGNGTIHWRTITKNGQDYPQAYYHWKENGQKRSKYIPKRLLEVVQLAEEQKRPIIEILAILGVVCASSSGLLVGTENSPSNGDEKLIPTSKESPSTQLEELIPTSKNRQSKTRRNKGFGTGFLQWKTISLNGKDYPQPWYHYEVWIEGARVTKKSKYIPKRLLAKIQELEAQKAPVSDILEVLGVNIIPG
ncbi:MAG: hypothetical protein SAK29_00880 [Scytonema sp. PMC 1069.18]|nr:hypothetical protein [Scytonema sp. PMC 1069.18]